MLALSMQRTSDALKRVAAMAAHFKCAVAVSFPERPDVRETIMFIAVIVFDDTGTEACLYVTLVCNSMPSGSACTSVRISVYIFCYLLPLRVVIESVIYGARTRRACSQRGKTTRLASVFPACQA
jgi:hypothetical protein